MTPSGTVDLPVEVSITPDEGYRMDWYELDGDIRYSGSRESARGVTVQVDDQHGFHALRAHFVVNPVLMVVQNQVEGRGKTDLPEKKVLPKEEWFDFTLDAGRGFHFSGLEIIRNATGGGEQRAFLDANRYFLSVCNSELTFCAAHQAGRKFPELPSGFSIFRWVFLPNPVVSATHGIGGTIHPHGLVWVPYRSRKTFTVTPEKGYEVKDVLMDGKSRGPQTKIILKSVRENHNIHVVFAPVAH